MSTVLPEIIYQSDVLLPRDPLGDLHAATKQYVDTGLAEKSNAEHTHTANDVTGLGTAATVNTGVAAGNVPVLDANGKLANSTMPALSITNTFTVASEAEMLALSAEEGDVAIRSDLNKTFILAGDDPTELTDWLELLSPTAVGTTDYATTITGDGATTSFEVTHSLGVQDVQVDVFLSTTVDEVTTLTPVQVLAVRTSTTKITLEFAVAPASGTVYAVKVRK